MGKGTITFSDDGDEIKCEISFDPPLDVENDEATPAQWKLLSLWQQIMNQPDAEVDSE